MYITGNVCLFTLEIPVKMSHETNENYSLANIRDFLVPNNINHKKKNKSKGECARVLSAIKQRNKSILNSQTRYLSVHRHKH